MIAIWSLDPDPAVHVLQPLRPKSGSMKQFTCEFATRFDIVYVRVDNHQRICYIITMKEVRKDYYLRPKSRLTSNCQPNLILTLNTGSLGFILN